MRLRPDIEIRPLRGNVHTRLRKVEDGEFDATILGMAGLNRLGLAAAITQILPVADFLPAVGQGAVAIETREDDSETRELLAAINHAPTGIAVTMERAFLAVLDGSCRTPIAGYAVLSGVEFVFRGMILPPLGGAIYETERTGTIEHASRLCADAGAELKRRAGADFMVQAV
jgi:hydroxymethylbilane synthase